MFGEICNTHEHILPSLESTGVRCLYTPGTDPRQELKKLSRSLVAAFLDLLEILIRCPDSKDRLAKLDDLRILFINTHHLINEYRPHQARETLHLLLQVQLAERKATIDRFDKQFKQVKQELSTCLNDIPQNLDIPEDLVGEIERVLMDKQQINTESEHTAQHKDHIMCKLTDTQ